MRVRQCVTSPAEHIVHDLALARTTDVRREQKIDAEDLRSEPDDVLSSLADLILELVDEGLITFIRSSDETLVDLTQDILTPDRGPVEKQRSVVQQTLGAEVRCHLVDLACVVFRIASHETSSTSAIQNQRNRPAIHRPKHREELPIGVGKARGFYLSLMTRCGLPGSTKYLGRSSAARWSRRYHRRA